MIKNSNENKSLHAEKEREAEALSDRGPQNGGMGLDRGLNSLKLKAKEWQATFDAISDALGILDQHYILIRANAAMFAFLDEKEDYLIGQSWLDVMARKWPSNDQHDNPFTIATTTRCRASVARSLYGRWYRIQVDPLLDEKNHQIQRFILLISDVTDEKLANLRLARINDALKSYAYTISHDLKGPLAGAVTANQLLQQLCQRPYSEKSQENIKELGHVIGQSVTRSIQLINELLALAEGTQLVDGKSPTDVKQVVERIIQERKDVLQEKKIRIEVSEIMGHVFIAPAHIYQVFANLIDNAIRYGSSGRPTIEIRRLNPTRENCHYFWVRDNGPGIPDELKDRIFEPFVKGKDGQSGIGLATVKRIIQSYHGEIRVYNRDGACFEFFFHDIDL